MTPCKNQPNAQSTRLNQLPLYQRGCIDEHTCACGEIHEQDAGDVSQRETCTSPLKFGNSCCCRSDDAAAKTHPTAAGMDRAVNKVTIFLLQTNGTMVRKMTDYRTIPELLEEYMQSQADAGLWVTVPEFRTCFALSQRFITCNSRVFPPESPKGRSSPAPTGW